MGDTNLFKRVKEANRNSAMERVKGDFVVAVSQMIYERIDIRLPRHLNELYESVSLLFDNINVKYGVDSGGL